MSRPKLLDQGDCWWPCAYCMTEEAADEAQTDEQEESQ